MSTVVRKLLVEVDNPTLKRFGVCEFFQSKKSWLNVKPILDAVCVFYIEDGKLLSSSGTEIIGSYASGRIIVEPYSQNGRKVTIKDSYDFNGYIDGSTKFYFENPKSVLNINVTERTTSVDDLKTLRNANKILVSRITASFELKELCNLTNLTELEFKYNSGIYGSLEDFAASQVGYEGGPSRTNARNLSVICNGVVTLDGLAVDNGISKTIHFGSSYDGGYYID